MSSQESEPDMESIVARLTERMVRLYNQTPELAFIPSIRSDGNPIPEGVSLKHLLAAHADLILKASCADSSSHWNEKVSNGSKAQLYHERQTRQRRIEHALHWWASTIMNYTPPPEPDMPYHEDESELNQLRIGVYSQLVHCGRMADSVGSERGGHALPPCQDMRTQAAWFALKLEMEQTKTDIECIDSLVTHSTSSTSALSSWFRWS